MTHKKSGNRSFFAKEGFVSVSLSWIVLSIIGALPFVLSGVIPNPVDAMFEIVSGFTTTGASILPEVESLPKCMLFWRSFSHWIGGTGIYFGNSASWRQLRSLFDECGKSGTEVWQIVAKAAKECNDTLWDLSDNDSD